ncbi:ArgP/LysG family DNA-binding transcriptional regulator [Marinomonas transparens]|uniref:ArgP/LysG family DNA-binding transcriptional regulator n=1 Tax=Marinomonas transparens TaxID=2795388 RepID=A0A934N2W6_9GAMM|nr:ArgP/LysG family DNA-binding transcriptional regulator [Marinomonas transparens]MBJ7538313.1 ArgP/LysG family DNA-binding transcriptional regulator [Marinomonas transparens]
MMDYRALTCLHAVLQFQSFDKAAQHLNLTQSAVSQNIKRLEQEYGQPLLIRARPVVATPLGQQLLAHINKVTMLEEGLQEHMQSSVSNQPLSIAVNNDVLATWFTQVVNAFSNISNTKLHIKSADQAHTRALLQKGEVITCISQTGTPVAGGDSLFLGNMKYELVATKSFIQTHLHGDITPASIQQAPSLIYDEYDELWGRYQSECLQIKANIRNSHWYPSPHGFLDLVLSGTVCALIPTVQIKSELETGRLISLFPDRQLVLPLYWHWYKLGSPVLDRLTKVILTVTKDALY